MEDWVGEKRFVGGRLSLRFDRFVARGVCGKMVKFAFGSIGESMPVFRERCEKVCGVWDGVMTIKAAAVGSGGDEGKVIG